MDYKTILTLFIAGILGVLAHGFKEASARNKKQEPKYSIFNYLADEINAVMMVVICLLVVAYYSSDIKQIKEMPTFGIGPMYFALGYMGDSAFPSLLEMLPLFIDKIKGFLGFKKQDPPIS